MGKDSFVGWFVFALIVFFLFQHSFSLQSAEGLVVRRNVFVVGRVVEGVPSMSVLPELPWSDVFLGAYHGAVWDVSRNMLVVGYQDFFDLADYPLGNILNSGDYAVDLGEHLSASASEMVFAGVNLKGVGDGGFIDVVYFYPNGTKLFTPYEHYVVDSGWDVFSYGVWLGHFPHEINTVGMYRIEVNSSWGGKTLYFRVVDSSEGVLCLDGDVSCSGFESLVCEGGVWVSQGLVDGVCGYTEEKDLSNVPVFLFLLLIIFLANNHKRGVKNG